MFTVPAPVNVVVPEPFTKIRIPDPTVVTGEPAGAPNRPLMVIVAALLVIRLLTLPAGTVVEANTPDSVITKSFTVNVLDMVCSPLMVVSPETVRVVCCNRTPPDWIVRFLIKPAVVASVTVCPARICTLLLAFGAVVVVPDTPPLPSEIFQLPPFQLILPDET